MIQKYGSYPSLLAKCSLCKEQFSLVVYFHNQAVYDHVHNKWAVMHTIYRGHNSNCRQYFSTWEESDLKLMFHNSVAARFIFRKVINTAARISHNLWEKTKLFQQQGVDGHFLYVPINRQEMLIPRESDIFNTLRMNFAQPKEFQLLW